MTTETTKQFTLYVRTEKCKRCGCEMTWDWMPPGKYEALRLKHGHS